MIVAGPYTRVRFCIICRKPFTREYKPTSDTVHLFNPGKRDEVTVWARPRKFMKIQPTTKEQPTMKKLFAILLMIMLPISAQAATIQLAWDRNADAITAGYNVYRSTVAGGCTPGSSTCTKVNLNLIAQPADPTTTPTYTDTTPAGSFLTYYYVVRAATIGGLESPNSNEVSVNPPPPAPTNLRVVSFTAANLNIEGTKVAGGPPFPVVYVLPRQTPPREIRVTVTAVPTVQ